MVNFDVVIPKGNEEEFIQRALDLGYTQILFLYTNSNQKKFQSNKISVKSGYLLKNPSELLKVKTNFDYIFAVAERKYFETNTDYIIDSELSDRKDSYHYRATMLNQVHAILAKKNNIIITLSFNNICSNPYIILSKMLQNATLIRK